MLRLHNKARLAFTVAEVLIAAGVLSVFIAAAFSVYSSSAKHFVLGSWRADEQKALRNFTARLSRDLGAATPALYSISSKGKMTSVFRTPIYINKDLLSELSADTQAPTKILDLTQKDIKWPVCLMAFSISYPHVSKSPFNKQEAAGKWSGVSVWADRGKLHYCRFGEPKAYGSVPINLPSSILYPDDTMVALSGTQFVPDTAQNGSHDFCGSVREAAVIKREIKGSSGAALEIKLKSIRYEHDRPTNSTITQSVLIKLMPKCSIREF